MATISDKTRPDGLMQHQALLSCLLLVWKCAGEWQAVQNGGKVSGATWRPPKKDTRAQHGLLEGGGGGSLNSSRLTSNLLSLCIQY